MKITKADYVVFKDFPAVQVLTANAAYGVGFQAGLLWSKTDKPDGPYVAARGRHSNPAFDNVIDAQVVASLNWQAGFEAGQRRRARTEYEEDERNAKVNE